MKGINKELFMKKNGVKIFGYGLLSLIFLSFIYLIIISEGTMSVKWSEFTQTDIKILYVFAFIYILSFVIYLFYDPSKKIEKRDLKKLSMKKPISIDEYKKLLTNSNKDLIFRTSIIGTHNQRHYISDKEGTVYYKIFLTNYRPDVFTIYDPFNNELGQIKTSLFDAFNIKDTLIIDNKEVFKFEKGVKDLKATYKVNGLNWTITENIDNNEFTIKSSNSNIGSVKKVDFADYDIVADNNNKILELSCLTLCFLLSDEHYRRIKE